MKGKRTSIWLLALTCILVSGSLALAGDVKFAVISDPHLYDSSLGTTGAAFEAYLGRTGNSEKIVR